MNKPKAVLVTGPESSGSKLIAKTLAHVMDIKEFGTWNGSRTVSTDIAKVHHQSLPSRLGVNKVWLNIDDWYRKHSESWDTYIIITTRDQSISTISKLKRFRKSLKLAEEEMAHAAGIIKSVIKSQYNYYIFSYESMILLQKEYINLLYRYLNIESDYVPSLRDGNQVYIRTNTNLFISPFWVRMKKTSKDSVKRIMALGLK